MLAYTKIKTKTTPLLFAVPEKLTKLSGASVVEFMGSYKLFTHFIVTSSSLKTLTIFGRIHNIFRWQWSS